MTRRYALAAAACLLAVACSDDPDLAGTSSGVRSSPSAAAPTSPVAPAPSASPAADPSVPFEADTTREEQDAGGGPYSVVAVRVAKQDGYDRVVFELDGREAGVPGWQVEYVDDPRRDGSGDPVEVDGDKTLVVLLRGAGYPFDTGVEEAEEVQLPGDLAVVADVELGSVFEGVYEAFVGTSGEAPFRVFRLSDPTRVVVDVLHE